MSDFPTFLSTLFIVAFLVLPYGSAVGQTVENSEWDGSVHQVETWLEENLKDPDSYESIEWYEVQQKYVDGKGSIYLVRHEYRSKNSFGGYTVNDDVFILDSEGTVANRLSYEKWRKLKSRQ